MFKSLIFQTNELIHVPEKLYKQLKTITVNCCSRHTSTKLTTIWQLSNKNKSQLLDQFKNKDSVRWIKASELLPWIERTIFQVHISFCFIAAEFLSKILEKRYRTKWVEMSKDIFEDRRWTSFWWRPLWATLNNLIRYSTVLWSPWSTQEKYSFRRLVVCE